MFDWSAPTALRRVSSSAVWFPATCWYMEPEAMPLDAEPEFMLTPVIPWGYAWATVIVGIAAIPPSCVRVKFVTSNHGGTLGTPSAAASAGSGSACDSGPSGYTGRNDAVGPSDPFVTAVVLSISLFLFSFSRFFVRPDYF